MNSRDRTGVSDRWATWPAVSALRAALVDGSWLQNEWIKLAGTEQLTAATAVEISVETASHPVSKSTLPSVSATVTRSTTPTVATGEAVNRRRQLHIAWTGADKDVRSENGGVWSKVRSVLLDYTRTSTIHGLALVGNQRYRKIERCVQLAVLCLTLPIFMWSIWAAVVVMNAALLGYVSLDQWGLYVNSPTVILTEQNDLPPYAFPFPAVTVCPARRIKEKVLATALDQYGAYMRSKRKFDPQKQPPSGNSFLRNTSSLDYQRFFLGVLYALTHYQHPKYSLMKTGLALIGRELPYLNGLIISQVMMKGRLTCRELLTHCYWRGIEFGCCEQFQLQRTEMGYCMSFNSRTSTGPKILCSEKNCHHVWSTGPGTGLVIVFKKYFMEDVITKEYSRILATLESKQLKMKVTNSPRAVWDSEEFFLLANAWTRMDHMLVMVHDRMVFPDVSSSVSFSTLTQRGYYIAVSYSGTVSSADLPKLPVKDRRCLYSGEMEVVLGKGYSQDECITECRVHHIIRVCGCRPYFIQSLREGAISNGGIPECSFTQLPCVSGLNLVAVNCTRCIPPCNSNLYNIVVTPSINVNVRDANIGTTVEVSYDIFRRAVLYRRQRTHTTFDIMVAMGGLASLCLGCSILTVLDILQVLLRAMKAAMGCELRLVYPRRVPGTPIPEK